MSVAEREEFGGMLKNEMQVYLAPTFTIESTHKNIVATAKEVTDSISDDKTKAVKLFYFVRDSIHYSFYMISTFIEDFRASRILAWRKGYCVQKAVLLAALGRAVDIPTRLAFAKIRNYKMPPKISEVIKTNVLPRHGYTQFFLNGRWVSATPAFDKQLCERHGMPTVEFDGESDAFLPEKDLNGEPLIQYIKKYPPEADLPFDWVVSRIAKIYGRNKRPQITA